MPRTTTMLAFLAALTAPLVASAEQTSPTPAPTEEALYANARAELQRAAALRQNAKLQDAVEQYKTAAGLFRGFIERFPNSPNAYEARFLYAESLFHSTQFAAAAAEYEKLRDTTAGTKFYADSADGAVRAWEAEVAEQVKAGRLAPLNTLSAKARKEGEKIAPMPIDGPRAKFVSAAEEFVKRLPEHEKTPKLAFQIALLHYQHDNFDEARKRFEQIVEKWPKQDVAKDAANLMIETYPAVRDWESVRKWTENPPPRPVFESALELFAAKKFDEAAEDYLRLVNQNPKYENNDKALQNAALAYQMVGKFETSREIYERIPSAGFARNPIFQ
ncbi:MAG: tetratricopeptide repeat protein [Deltaproteobacteria bacterium]|nr:tetratricopeptide repeat protein [Deltaproteobacteria bacterium]